MAEKLENGIEVGLICDFCEAELLKEDYDKKIFSWSRGQQGFVMPAGGVSGFCKQPQKVCCTNELCKAKLLVWAHS